MPPLMEISVTQANFLRGLFTEVGLPVDGQAFRVAFGDEGGDKGNEQIVVVGKKTIAADNDVIAAVTSLLFGEKLFRPISGMPTEVHPDTNPVKLDPSMNLRDLFQGESGRIPNVLYRGEIKTVGEVLEFLQSPGGEERLDAFRGVGPKTIAEIKRRLGLE